MIVILYIKLPVWTIQLSLIAHQILIISREQPLSYKWNCDDPVLYSWPIIAVCKQFPYACENFVGYTVFW